MDLDQYQARLPSIQKEYPGTDSLVMHFVLHFLVIE